MLSLARLGDLERRLSNIIRPGKIVEADYGKARVRVQIGANKTAWLPWVTGRAGGTRTWHPPEVGEQVIVMAPSGELGSAYVLPAVYQNAHPAIADSEDIARTVYKDGTVVEYDRKEHLLEADVVEDGKMVMTCGESKIEATKASVMAQCGKESMVEITENSIVLKCCAACIELSEGGIVLKAGGSEFEIDAMGTTLKTPQFGAYQI